MSHKKAAGSTRNGRDSNAQRRGVKKYGGQKVLAGNILPELESDDVPELAHDSSTNAQIKRFRENM